MVQINMSEREITVKVVYYGPALSGKTTNLQKLHEDQHRWAEAAAVRERIVSLDGSSAPAEQHILAFLRYQIGLSETAAGNPRAAVSAFKTAIDADPRTTPAYLSLGDAFEGAAVTGKGDARRRIHSRQRH